MRRSPRPIAPTEADGGQHVADTRLRGRGLVVAQVLSVVLAILIVGLFVAAVPARYEQLRNLGEFPAAYQHEYAVALAQLGLSATSYAAYSVVFGVAVALVFFAVAAVIIWNKPSDWMAIFVSLTFILLGATFGFILQGLAWANPATRLPVDFLYDLGRVGFVTFYCLFPDGRFVPRWTRWLTIGLLAWTLAWTFFPSFSPYVWPAWLWFMVRMTLFSIGLFAQIYRYWRVSSPQQRQQNKWVVFGLAADLVGFFGFSVFRFIFPALSQPILPAVLYDLAWLPVVTFTLLLVPLTTGIAILRARLWDIDVIINRTLVYSALTVTLALVYLASVVSLQRVVDALTGQPRSEVVTVTSTLAIAGLFNPLRRRIQIVIDRRFYHSKYDAARTLAAFSARMRDEVDLNTLTNELLAVVGTTMQPAHISLWLRTVPGAAQGSRPRADAPPQPATGERPSETESVSR